jgi:hypothetical protein
MMRSILLDLFNLPVKIFNTDFLQKWTLRWTGKKPTTALLYKFYRDSNLIFQKQSQLTLLNFDALKHIEKQTSYFSKQEIKENSIQDAQLLKSSSLNLYPHEVTQIRIINAQKEELCSKVFHGGPYEGLDAKTIKKEIRQLCYAARKKGLVIEEIEIAHTHPALEVMVTTGKESSFFFNGLSQGDRKVAQSISPFLDYPLRIKAISPAANYSYLY